MAIKTIVMIVDTVNVGPINRYPKNINGMFMIKVIGKNKLKKAKGRNVFTGI